MFFKDFETWEVFYFVIELPPLFVYYHSIKACSWQEQTSSWLPRAGPAHTLSKEVITGTNRGSYREVSLLTAREEIGNDLRQVVLRRMN